MGQLIFFLSIAFPSVRCHVVLTLPQLRGGGVKKQLQGLILFLRLCRRCRCGKKLFLKKNLGQKFLQEMTIRLTPLPLWYSDFFLQDNFPIFIN